MKTPQATKKSPNKTPNPHQLLPLPAPFPAGAGGIKSSGDGADGLFATVEFSTMIPNLIPPLQWPLVSHMNQY